MLPMVLDLTRLRLVLVGNGAAAERRLALLDEAGAADLSIYADDPSPRMVFIAERAARHARDLAATARAAGALVHVEDEPALCDLHAPATLRRGELVIAVSTGGQSPALAAQVKRFLGALFGTEWQQRLDELAALRHGWREGGADSETVARWTEEWVGRQGWLPPNGATDGDRSLAAARSAAALDAVFASRH